MQRVRHGFVTAGSWCADYNMTLPCWPSEDMSAPVSVPLVRGGGAACNFAIDMRKLDPSMPVETMGLLGDDADGRFLQSLADEYGIQRQRLIRTRLAATHRVDAFQSLASGRRTHLFYPGVSALLGPEHFDFSECSARILHLGLPGLHPRMDAPWQDDPNAWVTVLKSAKAAGLQTNLELVTVERERVAALGLPCLPYLDSLIVNDYEVGALAGIDTVRAGITDEDACRQAVRKMLHAGTMDVVVVHYVLGAQLVARDGSEIHLPSVAVPPSALVGANGAGDAFAAGFLYARHQAWSHLKCLELAHATAAASLRAIGTTDGVASAPNCLELAKRWGWRAPRLAA